MSSLDDPTPATHWENVHSTKTVDGVSWWQEPDDVWFDLVELTGVATSAHVVDMGSGSSTLVDTLLAHGFTDITAVDLSATALERLTHRVEAVEADARQKLHAVVSDARTFRATHAVDLWFDRAVFHFLVTDRDRAAYAESLRANLAPGGYAVVATFALDGPERCSDLPVTRHDTRSLVAALGAQDWTTVHDERRVHTTPWGAEQPFTVVVLQRPA